MEPTKENFDKLNNQLSIVRTIIIAKYQNKLKPQELEQLNLIFDKKIIQLMPKFKGNMSVQAAYLPVLERTAEMYYNRIKGNVKH